MKRFSRTFAVTTAVALFAIVFNATALLWHTPMRASMTTAESALARDLALICHGAGPLDEADPATGVPAAPSDPSKKKTPECPVCQSLAAAGPAILKDAVVLVRMLVASGMPFARIETRGTTLPAGATRNRGPPAIA